LDAHDPRVTFPLHGFDNPVPGSGHDGQSPADAVDRLMVQTVDV
jgi:hypothetical protein